MGGLWMVLTSLNFYLIGLTAWNVFLTTLFQYIFLRFFDTIFCAVNLANIVLHWHSRLNGWSFLIGLLDASYYYLIQLCRVQVLQMELGLWVLVPSFVVCCMLLLVSTLQGRDLASAVGPVVVVCRRRYALMSFPFTGVYQCHDCIPPLLKRLVTIHFHPIFFFIWFFISFFFVLQCCLQWIWEILLFSDVIGSLVDSCSFFVNWLLVFLLDLLQFTGLGFYNRDWNYAYVIPHWRVGFVVRFTFIIIFFCLRFLVWKWKI